jgi:hypothetical protein
MVGSGRVGYGGYPVPVVIWATNYFLCIRFSSRLLPRRPTPLCIFYLLLRPSYAFNRVGLFSLPIFRLSSGVDSWFGCVHVLYP